MIPSMESRDIQNLTAQLGEFNKTLGKIVTQLELIRKEIGYAVQANPDAKKIKEDEGLRARGVTPQQ